MFTIINCKSCDLRRYALVPYSPTLFALNAGQGPHNSGQNGHNAGRVLIFGTIQYLPFLDKLENMQKLFAFYLSNMKKELPYYSIGKSAAELKEIIRDAEIFEDEELLEEDFEDKDNTFEEEEILEIEKIVNLDAKVIVKDLGKIIDEEVRELEGGIMPINIEDNNNGNNEINEYEGWRDGIMNE